MCYEPRCRAYAEERGYSSRWTDIGLLWLLLLLLQSHSADVAQGRRGSVHVNNEAIKIKIVLLKVQNTFRTGYQHLH